MTGIPGATSQLPCLSRHSLRPIHRYRTTPTSPPMLDAHTEPVTQRMSTPTPTQTRNRVKTSALYVFAIWIISQEALAAATVRASTCVIRVLAALRDALACCAVACSPLWTIAWRRFACVV